jgi:hypothetical protein
VAEAYNNQGFTRYVKGDFDGALSDYEEAIRLAHNNRALARKAKVSA